jgi:hypothetical protein
MLVVAPPGAGKTWTAARRLSRLANTGPADDDNDIPRRLLAISFSRAAAAAMSAQLHEAGVGAMVEVRTLDSWTTSLLRDQLLSDDELDSLQYDQRIVTLRDALARKEVELSQPIRHVVVDEAQDIWGARADLTEVLLASPITQGWTVLGDPAQAIFGFDDEPGPHLFERLTTQGLADVVELHASHRTDKPALLALRDLGAGLRTPRVEPGCRDVLSQSYRRLNSLTISDVLRVAPSYIAADGTTAILLRNNRQVLDLASKLGARAVEHSVAAGRTEGIVPSWVAGFWPFDCSKVSSDDLVAALPGGVDACAVLRAWKALGDDRGARRRTDSLADAILAGRTPDPFRQAADVGLLVSTVHRAKGLEFDRVVVGALEPTASGVEDSDDEARVLYVAITRATTHLMRLRDGGPQRSKRDPQTHRWLDFRFVGRRRVPTAFEVKPSDVNFLNPWSNIECRLDGLTSATAGDEVLFEWDSRSTADEPRYSVVATEAGDVLGTTTPELSRVLRVLGWEAPTSLSGAWVTGRQTLALPHGATRENRRLVIAPVIRGMVSRDRERKI